MIKRNITFCAQTAAVVCDENCAKAWGRSKRPLRYFSGDPMADGLSAKEQDRRRDDYVYLSDSDLGQAPVDPGTTEGDHRKPRTLEQRMNKWCVRECERCAMSEPGQWREALALPDLENPRPNMGWRSITVETIEQRWREMPVNRRGPDYDPVAEADALLRRLGVTAKDP